MAEFLGMGDRGTARYIYFRTWLLQTGLATLATGGFIFWVLRDASRRVQASLGAHRAQHLAFDGQQHLCSGQRRNGRAVEEYAGFRHFDRRLFFVVILATVVFHWGVVGVGASLLLMRLVDFLVRFFPTMARISTWDTTHVQPAGLRNRMIAFAWQSVASMIVALIVWERSEFILLKHLCADIRQVAYYSVAFSMAERLLIGAIDLRFGGRRDDLCPVRARQIQAPRHHCIHFPLPGADFDSAACHSAALAAPALLLLYGRPYKGALMVVTLAPLLCMPKAFIGPVQSLLQSNERQGS